MADSTIGNLPAASALNDSSLLVVEQLGAAMKLTGLLLKQYVQNAVQPQVDAAEASADAAGGSATAASNSATAAAASEAAATVAKTAAETARAAAEEAAALAANKTSVTVNGEHVDTFDADTKLNKQTDRTLSKVYGFSGSTQKTFTISVNPTRDTVAGCIPTYFNKKNYGSTPVEGALLTTYPILINQAANKQYVDDIAATKQDKLTASGPLYIDSSNNIGLNHGNGLTTGCNGLEIEWHNIPLEDTLYYGCNGLGIAYGSGLTVSSGCNSRLCVDWSNMPVDSSTFYVDSCNGLQINSYNNLLNIGLYDYDNVTHIYLSSNNLDIYSSYDLYMTASSNVLVGACNNITLKAASNSILFLGDKSSYGGCNFPLDCGLWLKDICGIGMNGSFGGINVGDKKIGIEADGSNTIIVLTHNESPLRQIKITDDGVHVNAENSLIEATSSHLLLQYGSDSKASIEIKVDGVYIGGVKYGA